jgi:putative glutamine amidotransferase
MRDHARPVVAIPARFSASASALRSRADVIPRAVAEAVFAAGGDPVVLHPDAPGAVVDTDAAAARLWFADAVLLPGGGDIAARWSGQEPHPSLYDVDEEQDAFDLALARVALAEQLPLLAVCRGVQIVNVALGGDLVQDMADTGGHHRHRVHEIDVDPESPLGEIVGERATISCYHHQCIGRLADGLRAAAHSSDGVIEAVTLEQHAGWSLGVQWHPEDTAATDPMQAAIFEHLVDAAAARTREHRRAVAGPL